MTILQGPVEVLVGLVYGCVAGVVCIYLPSSSSNSGQRLIMLVGSGLLAIFGLPLIDLPGAGPLAVLVTSFTVGVGWRRQSGYTEHNPVTQHLSQLWTLLQPLLFSLIGAEVDLGELDSSVVGLATAVLCIGLIIRLMVSQLAVMGGDLSFKERLFVSFAWLPKATVQAAIGPIALDKVKNLLSSTYPDYSCNSLQSTDVGNSSLSTSLSLSEMCQMLEYGDIILTVSVLVIIITAPLGALAILMTGPRLLKSQQNNQQSKLE